MNIRNVFCCSATALFLPLVFAAQTPSARDAFWSASDLISVTPNPAVHHNSKPRSNSLAQKTTSAPTTIAPAAGSVNQPQASRESQVSELVAQNGYGAAPHLVRSSETRLGLRCSILLRGNNKEYSEVTPGTVYHSGDHIRLSFLANQSGYFYVIQQGSSGAWSPI